MAIIPDQTIYKCQLVCCLYGLTALPRVRVDSYPLTHSLTRDPECLKWHNGASLRVLHCCCQSSAHCLAVSRLRPHSSATQPSHNVPAANFFLSVNSVKYLQFNPTLHINVVPARADKGVWTLLPTTGFAPFSETIF